MTVPCSAIPALLITGMLLLTAGCTGGVDTGNTPYQNTPPVTGTSPNETLVSFVKEVVAYAHSHGREEALAEISSRNGSFFRGDLYIYAYDFNGTTVGHPVNPEKIGANRLHEKDAVGNLFITLLQDQAINGSGFARYYYINPAHGNAVEEKLGYVEKVDDTWWLGSGVYSGTASRGSVAGVTSDLDRAQANELVTAVEKAAAYAIENGRDDAVRAFNDPSGMFTKGDDYIFAYDMNGTLLAWPYRPDLIGKNRLNETDPAGIRHIRAMVEAARTGSGFIPYFTVNPVMNSTEKKISYVYDIDGTWFVGSGKYTGENLTGYLAGGNVTGRSALNGYVRAARDYARLNGKAAALAAFNRRDGPFTNGDRYIFAYDYNGTTLALPFQPELVGTNRWDLVDLNGVMITRTHAGIARSGGGYDEIVYPNPAHNMTPEKKTCYVIDVDGTYFIGSGIYPG